MTHPYRFEMCTCGDGDPHGYIVLRDHLFPHIIGSKEGGLRILGALNEAEDHPKKWVRAVAGTMTISDLHADETLEERKVTNRVIQAIGWMTMGIKAIAPAKIETPHTLIGFLEESGSTVLLPSSYEEN